MKNVLKNNTAMIAIIAILVLLILTVIIFQTYQQGYKKGLQTKNQIIDSYSSLSNDYTDQNTQDDNYNPGDDVFPPPITAKDFERWAGIADDFEQHPEQYPGMFDDSFSGLGPSINQEE